MRTHAMNLECKLNGEDQNIQAIKVTIRVKQLIQFVSLGVIHKPRAPSYSTVLRTAYTVSERCLILNNRPAAYKKIINISREILTGD